jgi:hypothetical protein
LEGIHLELKRNRAKYVHLINNEEQ